MMSNKRWRSILRRVKCKIGFRQLKLVFYYMIFGVLGMQYRIVLGGGVYYMGEVPRNTRRIGGGVMFRISSVGI